MDAPSLNALGVRKPRPSPLVGTDPSLAQRILRNVMSDIASSESRSFN
jgi:hypothetical protein